MVIGSQKAVLGKDILLHQIINHFAFCFWGWGGGGGRSIRGPGTGHLGGSAETIRPLAIAT
jgi:hypothetical protein